MPTDGGDKVEIPAENPGFADVSPDGRWIALEHFSLVEEVFLTVIDVIPIEGGEPTDRFEIGTGVSPEAPSISVRWTPDGSALTYLLERDGVRNLWSQPLAGGEPTQLTHFVDNSISHYDWNRADGRLVMARGDNRSDAVLIRNFR